MEPEIHVIAEPSCKLVASAGCPSTRVVGSAIREQQHWLQLDNGYFGGLMELADHCPLPMHTDCSGSDRTQSIAGPSCDSIDTLSHACALLDDLIADDVI